MPALPLSPSALVALMLVSAASLSLQPALSACPSRLELVAEPEGALPEVCLSPGLPTTFRFDAPLSPGAVQVKGRERLGDMPLGTHSFTVLPPEDLQAGERFEVTVHFPDGAAPTRATFTLVAHPAFAPRQVAVFRHPRTVEDYRKETQEEREKARRLGQEVAHLQAQQGPGGLTGALAAGVLPLDETGVLARLLTPELALPKANALAVIRAFSYRAKIPTQEGVVRVAVAMEATNMGTEPWQAHEAALVGRTQEVKKAKAWLRAPLAPMEDGLLVVEAELTEQEARGTFQLKVWDESGRRLVVLGNVTFPVTQ